MTVQERARRAAGIAAARGYDVTWSRIAADYGVSVRQAQNIYADWKATDTDGDEDGLDEIERLISLLPRRARTSLSLSSAASMTATA